MHLSIPSFLPALPLAPKGESLRTVPFKSLSNLVLSFVKLCGLTF